MSAASLGFCFGLCAALPPAVAGQFEQDTIKTSADDLVLTFIGHGTLMLAFPGTTIHIDPYSDLADYTKLPPADIVLITHHHDDHLDPAALQKVRTPKTIVVHSALCAQSVTNGVVMKNGDTRTIGPLTIEAVPAYNIKHVRSNGLPFHAKGEGNGYVLTIGGKRLYIAGDTENIPEMKSLSKIDIAFLPVDLPYTMTPEMAADAARSFKPKVLYPYHYGETDIAQLAGLLKTLPEIEVRIRKMQ
jgi:L-ascorbate metabolism protein UlaG (beta-lactamase superfamily)